MNILFLTTHFPSVIYDNKQTKMGYYYTSEWQKSGHGVRVIHVISEFVTGYRAAKKLVSAQPFEYEGIRALEILAARYIPKYSFITAGQNRRMARRTVSFLEEDSFVPELIVVDFPNPLWGYASMLKKAYCCRTVPLFHNCDTYNYLRRGHITDICRECNIVGVRSLAIAERLDKAFGNRTPYYWAKSGVPEDTFNAADAEYNDGNMYSLVFSGSLIPRKNVDTIIRAMALLAGKYPLTLDIAGDGEQLDELKALVDELGVADRVRFRGRVSRDESLALMRRCGCFITVSRSETFGMVYVEAMASRCYVIGSRGEGIDGVLVDGHNGALVRAGDPAELTAALEKYCEMPRGERERIVSQAYSDARKLTDPVVAEELLAYFSGEKKPE